MSSSARHTIDMSNGGSVADNQSQPAQELMSTLNRTGSAAVDAYQSLTTQAYSSSVFFARSELSKTGRTCYRLFLATPPFSF